MANAAAQSAATASTSVEVVPDIQTSVQSFIDPECLRPTCEQYVPETVGPGPTPTPECPEPQGFKWDFGQVAPGMRVSITRPMPRELLQAIEELGVVSSTLISSNLPPGLSFELLLDYGQGRLAGQVPSESAMYELSFTLFDRRQCPVGQLYVLIRVGQPTRPTEPTGPECPEPQALRWDYGEVKGGTLHFLTLKQMPSELLSQIRSAGAKEAELLSSGLPQGVEFALDLARGVGRLAGYMPPQAANYEVVFALYNAEECEVVHLSVLIRVGRGEAQAQPLSVEILRAAADQVCGDKYSHAVTVYWQATGGTPPLSVGPVGIRYPDGHVETRIDHFAASGSMTFQVNLREGGTVTVLVQVRDAQGRSQTAQRQVELEPCVTIGVLPPLRVYPAQVQLEVRAHHIIYATPGYEDIEVPVRLSDEEEERYTPFTVQQARGTQVTLIVPARSDAAGPYGVAFRGFKVWIGNAETPVEYPGTFDRGSNTYRLTLTLNASTRVIAEYQDIIG